MLDTANRPIHNLKATIRPTKAEPVSRIPAALQAVFLAANRGKDIAKPPPNQVAARTFRRRFFSGRPKAFPADTADNNSNNCKANKIENGPALANRKHSQSPVKTSPKVGVRKSLNSAAPSPLLTSPRAGAKKSIQISASALLASPKSPYKKSVVIPASPVSENVSNLTAFVLCSQVQTLILSSLFLQRSMAHHVSPQSYCTSLLNSRGYSTTSFRSLVCAYYNKPTPLQLDSYGHALTEAIQTGNLDALRELLDLGLSPNACNAHGESIVHMVCRSGKKDVLQVLLDHGGSVQVADDYGRTPLHDACFCREPNFDIVDMILAQDRRLLYITDSKGSLPLSFLRSEQWTAWTKFLMSRKERYWPDRDISKHGLEADPPLTLDGPNSRPFPDPKDSLPVELLRMVANKRMSPMEASMLKDDLYADQSSCCDSTSEDFSSSFDDSSVSDEDDDEDDDEEDEDDSSSDCSGFDESELEQILGCIGKGQAIAWSS